MTLGFISGGAASGKLIEARAPANLTGLARFHNHPIVDAVTSAFPFGGHRIAAGLGQPAPFLMDV
jgi:hypothetical protein